MNRKMIFLAILALTLASLACTININPFNTENKTGPRVTEDINVPFLPGQQTTADVTLKFGAGELSLQPGAVDGLISGTATYNVADFKPVITTESNNINVEQGNLKLGGIPFINQDIVNEWELSLGNRPMSLKIEAGAYTGNYELGGLSISKLDVTDGAAKVQLSFSEPNQIEMTSFEYNTGASNVTLSGLGNANLSEMKFNGGAGNYTLDFSGQLTRNMTVNIDAGVSTITVIVPEGVAAELYNDSNLVTISTGGGWEQHGNTYLVAGSGYTITINARLGAGTLKLETSK